MNECCTFCGSVLDVGAARCRDCNLAPDATGSDVAQEAEDEIAYDIADWPVGDRLSTTALLAERGVPWRWEPDLNLVVRQQDEDAAEEVLEEVEAAELEGGEGNVEDEDAGEHEDGDEDDDEDDDEEFDDDDDDDEFDEDEEFDDDEGDDGAVAQAAMADLFVAADRLMHEPDNVEVAVELEAAAEVVDTSPPPFGIEGPVWKQIRDLASAVRSALDGQDEAEVDPDEQIAERARALRDTLRPWI